MYSRAFMAPLDTCRRNQRDTLLEKCLAGIYFFKGRLSKIKAVLLTLIFQSAAQKKLPSPMVEKAVPHISKIKK